MRKTRTIITLMILSLITLTACKDNTASVETSVEPTVSVETSVDTSVKVEEPVEVEHIFEIKDMGDGTHAMYCAELDEVKDIEPHTYENGICTVCGHECTHEDVSYEPIEVTDTFKHKVVCNECGYETEGDCVDEDSDWICDKCGQDMSYIVTPIEETTLYSSTDGLNIRTLPSTTAEDCEVVGKYKLNDTFTVKGEVNSFRGTEEKWYQLSDGNFVVARATSTTKVEPKPAPTTTETQTSNPTPSTSTASGSEWVVNGKDWSEVSYYSTRCEALGIDLREVARNATVSRGSLESMGKVYTYTLWSWENYRIRIYDAYPADAGISDNYGASWIM